jgi:hypothetical protein
MYALDIENRTTLQQTLSEKIASFRTKEKKSETTQVEIPEPKVEIASFVDMLKPLNNSSQETLDFIIAKLKEAEFEPDLFNKVQKFSNGKNVYGLNGAIAAMIDFFWQHNYFKDGYSIEEIFKAYSAFTNNSIAKLRTFLSDFRKDKSYIKYFEKLKHLKINKMK